jgi:hypothetical protein
MNTETLVYDIFKLVLQLVFLSILGGLITKYYSNLQKKKELKKKLLSEFTSLHGKFISLRFKNNSFHIKWSEKTGIASHPLKHDEKEKELERWKFYQEACDLLGEYEAIKHIMIATFPQITNQIHDLQTYYQDWRRMSGKNEPIMQNENGDNTDKYRTTKDLYREIALLIRNEL